MAIELLNQLDQGAVESARNESQDHVASAVDSFQYADDGSITTDSGAQPCGSPSENDATPECGHENSAKILTS